jgi:TRAP-type uncharacterized transport system substrate-binding protein
MVQEPSDRNVHRRKFLQLAGATGAISLAGCSSNGDGDGSDGGDGGGGETNGGPSSVELTMVTSQSDTAAFGMSQAIAQVMNEQSDIITLEASPAGGAAQGMAQMDQGNADIAYSNALNAIKIANEEGIYADNPFQNDISQLFHYYDVQYGWMTSEQFWDEGLQMVGDLAGHPVSPKAAGTASRDVIFGHLSKVMDVDELGNLLSLAGSEDASALSEGRAHAVNDIRLNVDVAPGYIQEMYSIIDNVYQLGWPQDAIDEIKNDDRLTGFELTSNDIDPAPETGEGVPWWPTAKYVIFTNEKMSDEVANEFVSVIYNNVDTLEEASALTGYWSDASFFTDVSSALPVQPGAQSFFDTL